MVTQTQFNAFREDVLRNQPIRKTINLTDLKFITMDTVEFSGLKLGINRQALKDLVRVIGMSVTGLNNLEGALGEDAAQKFINAMKNAIGASKGLQVTIAVTPDRVISRIQKAGSTDLISAETYFDTVERLVNVHNLDIQSMDFNRGNGNIYMNTIAPKTGQYQVGNLSDEVFTTGLSLSRTMDGIQADPFMHRLVCTNGMVTRMFEESFKLRSMDTKMWQEFYQHLEKIEKAGFAPTKFADKVNQAINCPASLKELEQGIHLLQQNSNVPDAELEFFFKGQKNTYNRIHSAGIDTTKLTDAQKANVRTGLTVWDVINGITDFASHNYGYEKKANSDRHLQMRAGDILSKNFDTQNLVLNQPF